MRTRALVVEDHPPTQKLLSEILEADGAEVSLAGDGDVAIEMLSRDSYSVVLLDIVLPRVSGMAVMEFLRDTNPTMLEKVIVVTGVDVSEIRALFPTVTHALSKPVLPNRLRASVRECLPTDNAASTR